MTSINQLVADLDKVVTLSESAGTQRYFQQNESAGDAAMTESYIRYLKAYRDRVRKRSVTDAPAQLGHDPGDKIENPGSGYELVSKPNRAYFDGLEECAPVSHHASIRSVRQKIVG